MSKKKKQQNINDDAAAVLDSINNKSDKADDQCPFC